ncbi:PTS sugar transporter subunit IIA [Agromyces sp. NPDC058484]|uniref:PTS sugar transporter subunit IIA n=1 Tax=Agromyces sp. NPDC058484 TaxID=3346524 RepID=UPI0036605429
MTTIPPLPDTAVVLGARVGDWRAAVRAAGRALTRSGSTRSEYADRMIAVIEEFGAYVVIAPGLALAHARPGADVRSEGLAVVTLAEPVAFGHPHNDPVRVVVGLAVSNAEEHVASIARLANTFNDRRIVGRIARATSADEVRGLLGMGAPTDGGPNDGAPADGGPTEGGSTDDAAGS